MRKYEYINSEIEWLDTVPKHWKVDRIKDKTTDVVGGDWGNDPESEVEGKNIVVLRVADLDGIYFNYDELTVRKIKESSFISRKVTDRSLIIEKSGGGEKQLVGRVGYPLGMNFDAICSNFMAKIDFDKTVDIKFANYVLSSLYSSKLNFPFVQQTTGIQNLNVTYYLNSKFPFPPLPEQKAIADYLDKACHRIDKIIEIKERQLEKLENYFFSRLDEMLTCKKNKKENSQKYNGFINRNVPNKWKIDRLRDVAIINEEALKSGTSSDFTFNYLDIGNVNRYGIIDIDNIKELNFETAPSRARRITKKYDTVISSVRTNLQAVAFIDNDIKNLISSTGFFVCRPKFTETLMSKFLYYFLLTVYSKDYFFSLSTGVSYPAIGDYSFGGINIFLPPIEEQKVIVEHLDKLKLKINSVTELLNSQITTLQSYRKSLIHECITGKKQVWEGEIK